MDASQGREETAARYVANESGRSSSEILMETKLKFGYHVGKEAMVYF